MVIDAVLNRKYNAILSDIRKGLKSFWNLKEYREVMKMTDPFFKRVDGIPISMKIITQEEMSNHISFLRMYSIRRGYIPKGSTDEDVAEVRSIKIVPRAFLPSEEDGLIKCSVVCSTCGGATVRILKKERFIELGKIEKGELAEQVGINSFKCLDCYSQY